MGYECEARRGRLYRERDAMASRSGKEIPVAQSAPGCPLEVCGLEAAWAAAISTTTTAATGAILSLVDLQRTAIEVFAVQSLHGARSVRIRHFDECEATGPAGLTVGNQGYLLDRAMSGEQRADAVFGC